MGFGWPHDRNPRSCRRAGRPLRDLVAEVAAAYLAHADVPLVELPRLFATISCSLGAVRPDVEPREPARPTPDQISASITREALISFENGRRYQLLRRHLSSRGMTPAQYRAKWGLPPDYPMVAPDLQVRRSAISRGRRPRLAAAS
jgi:predicted transcriptional regulator